MRTNAQFDSTWCTIISPQDAWAGASLTDLIATPDGGCLVVGQTGHGDSPRILKINSTGSITWDVTGSVSGYIYNSVCLTSDGGYIATGGKRTSTGYESNLLVTKLNSAGATVWNKIFYSGSLSTGDKKVSVGLSVAATSDGGCMVAGNVSRPGEWASSALLMRLNATGDSLWTKKYYPWKDPNETGRALKVLRLPSDQYLMFLKKNTTTVPEATLMKVNSSGDSLWTQVGYGSGIGNMVGTDSEGGIILTGTTGGANYYDCVGVFIRTTSGGMYKSPELMSPSNTYTGIDMIPTLEWRGSPWSGGPFHKPTSFRVQVARDSAFANIVYDKSSVTTTKQQTTKLLALTKYIWRVQSFGKEGSPTKWSPVFSFTTGVSTSVETIDSEVPLSFSLKQNYPNPFNPNTVIRFSLPHKAKVLLEVFNLLGQRVEVLIDKELDASSYKVNFNAVHFASGIYFYQLITDDFIQAKKMLLIK
ncbi:MAG: T9SS type A sorting domain-containing protein [Ignavibacteriales bacterium]|nr:T9SS type A sorting domain-containing protein [Ignavibacteriales bacterium]